MFLHKIISNSSVLNLFINKLLLVIVAFFVVACQDQETLPEGILSHEEMVNLMVDVELAQAELKYDYSKANKKIEPKARFEAIFAKHRLTKEQFDTNIEYYGANPLQTKDIYVDVIEELSSAQASNK